MSSTYLKRLNDGRYEYGDLIRREGKYEEVSRGVAHDYESGRVIMLCARLPGAAAAHGASPAQGRAPDPDLADPGHEDVAVTAGECSVTTPAVGQVSRACAPAASDLVRLLRCAS
jgi:hypothetical protein